MTVDFLTQNSYSAGFKHEAFLPGPSFHDDTVRGGVQLVVDAVSLTEGHFSSESQKLLRPEHEQ